MVEAPFVSSLIAPVVVTFLPPVTEGLQMTPKPTIAITRTITEPDQAAVLAPSTALFLSVAIASAFVRPSSSSGMAAPSRQASEGVADVSALPTDSV